MVYINDTYYTAGPPCYHKPSGKLEARLRDVLSETGTLADLHIHGERRTTERRAVRDWHAR